MLSVCCSLRLLFEKSLYKLPLLVRCQVTVRIDPESDIWIGLSLSLCVRVTFSFMPEARTKERLGKYRSSQRRRRSRAEVGHLDVLLAHVLDLLLALLLVELLLHRLVQVIAALLVSWGTLLLRNISLGGFAFLVNLMNSFCLKISLNA